MGEFEKISLYPPVYVGGGKPVSSGTSGDYDLLIFEFLLR